MDEWGWFFGEDTKKDHNFLERKENDTRVDGWMKPVVGKITKVVLVSEKEKEKT